MEHKSCFAPGCETAEDTVEGDQTLGVLDGGLALAQVAEQMGGDIVGLHVSVSLQLVQRVGVVVAGVAPHLGRVGAGKHVQLPLVGRTPLPDVVEERKPCQVFVRFAVQLEVGLQVGLVCAQFANVGSRDIHGDLSLASLAASVHRKMTR